MAERAGAAGAVEVPRRGEGDALRMRDRLPGRESAPRPAARAAENPPRGEPQPERAQRGTRVVRLHSLPGRERLKVGGLQRNAGFKVALERQLALREGVLSVRANIVTGKLVLIYEERRYRRGVLGLVRR